MKYLPKDFAAAIFGRKVEFQRRKLRIFIKKHFSFNFKQGIGLITALKQSVSKLLIYSISYMMKI